MKFKKLLAGVCAMSIAASMMAVSASAATVASPGESPILGPSADNYIVDANEELGKKVLQFDLATFEGIEADIASITIKAVPYNGNWDGGQGWFGGGGNIGYNAADSWQQEEIDTNETSDLIDAWKTTAGADGGANNTEFAFTINVPEGTKFTYVNEDETSGGIFQFGYYWGSQPVLEITDVYVTFTDETVVGIAGKSGREQAAANALKELQDAYDKFDVDVDEVVASTTAAAEALGNTTAAVEDINAAIEKVNGLKAVLAKAQAAFDALKEGDNADTDAFKTAKAAVEKAAADLEAAQTALDKAIAAYDEKTAAEKKDLQDKIDALNKQIAELETDAATNADKIAALEAEKAELEKQLEDAKKNPPAAGGSDNSGTGSQGGSENNGSQGGSENSSSKGDNPGTGATAGLALAGLALAGAAVVASKKRK